MRCEEIRDLAPEIALGIADGEERAEALRHLSTCAECRRAVDQLTQVADELLMLAPVQEPPAGFESRAVDAMGLGRPPRRRVPRWLAPRWLAPRFGAALATAAVTAAVLIGVYNDDRQTADRYREALDEAGGQYFQADRLADEAGARGGVVFGYEGAPSWVFVTVDPVHRGAVKTAELVTRDGRTIRLRGFELDRSGAWGGTIPGDLYQVASVRLLGERPGEILQADLR
jgi:Putative zinc-finger